MELTHITPKPYGLRGAEAQNDSPEPRIFECLRCRISYSERTQATAD